VDGYGAMVKWYWQGKTEVRGEKHYTAWVVHGWIWRNGGMLITGEDWSTGKKILYTVGGRWMDMEQWWNDTDRGKLKYWEKNILQFECWMDGYRAKVEWHWQGKLKYWEKNIIRRRWWMDGYGAMVEWYWQGKTEVLGEKHFTAWVVDGCI